MIVDSSAIVAVVFGEPEASAYRASLVTSEVRVSSVSLVETTMVVEARSGAEGGRLLAELMVGTGASVEPVTAEQADLAIAAWRRFGKGRHPAGLNLGDCFSYALAKSSGEPLLFKGDDFAQTDIASAL